MRFNKYTKEDFIEAVKTSYSISQVLTKLNVAPYGGNYKVANNYIEKLSLDISHFTGQAWSKGQNFGPKRPIEVYLNNEVKIGSYRLKERLIKEGYFEHKCYECNLKEWNNNPIAIELHHIDGNHYNNNLSNLQILCPNCHAQTDNYRNNKKQSKSQ